MLDRLMAVEEETVIEHLPADLASG